MKNLTNQSLLSETDTFLIRAELERLLSDRRFSGARQMSAFLRYIVSETLDGNGNRIKAYTVGVDALGKPDDFDAQSDPSVRVLALRLRKSLEAAYADEPECHARIVMTVGSYVPEFYKPHAFVSSGDGTDGFQRAGSAAVSSTARIMSEDNVDTSLLNDSSDESHLSSRRLLTSVEIATQSRLKDSYHHGGTSESGMLNVARVALMPDPVTAMLRDTMGVIMTVALLAAVWQVSNHTASAATVSARDASPQAEVLPFSKDGLHADNRPSISLNKTVVLQKSL